jgi:hypothetical protein
MDAAGPNGGRARSPAGASRRKSGRRHSCIRGPVPHGRPGPRRRSGHQSCGSVLRKLSGSRLAARSARFSDTPRLQRHNLSATFLLSLPQVTADSRQIVVEPGCIFLAVLPNFFDDRVLPHGSILHQLLRRADCRRLKACSVTDAFDPTSCSLSSLLPQSHWQSQWHPFMVLDSASPSAHSAVALYSNQSVVCRRFAAQVQNRCTTAG